MGGFFSLWIFFKAIGEPFGYPSTSLRELPFDLANFVNTENLTTGFLDTLNFLGQLSIADFLVQVAHSDFSATRFSRGNPKTLAGKEEGRRKKEEGKVDLLTSGYSVSQIDDVGWVQEP